MTLREIAVSRKARKGQAAGITADGAYWLPVKIAIYIGGGDGIGQSRPVIEDSLIVRHYRNGELRAYAARESWHHDRGGSSWSRMRRDTLLDCSTVEEIIQILVSIPLESGEYESGRFEVTPEGKQRLIDDLTELPEAQPGPDESL